MDLPWPQLAFLCEQVLEEHDNRRHHLLKGVLVDDFIHQPVLVACRNHTRVDSVAVVDKFRQDVADPSLSFLRLVAEYSLQRVVCALC